MHVCAYRRVDVCVCVCVRGMSFLGVGSLFEVFVDDGRHGKVLLLLFDDVALQFGLSSTLQLLVNLKLTTCFSIKKVGNSVGKKN